MASVERITDPDTGEHLGTIAWPDRKKYPHAYFTLNPGEDMEAEIIEDAQQRRLNSYEIAFEKHLQATIKHRREAFEMMRKAREYAAVCGLCAFVSLLAVFWMVL